MSASIETLEAIPGNWYRHAFCLDIFTQPEIIPGIETPAIYLSGSEQGVFSVIRLTYLYRIIIIFINVIVVLFKAILNEIRLSRKVGRIPVGGVGTLIGVTVS